MSNNKSTTLSVSNIPHFNDCNFQGWSEKMISVFMMAKIYDIIKGTSSKPAESELQVAPTMPAAINTNMAADLAHQLNAMWTQYNIQMNAYNHPLESYN